MNCPVSTELLVRYWARDLAEAESEAVEAHVFGCDACFEASSRVAAMADALASVIPPILTGRDVALAEARGVRQATNDFVPGVPAEAWLRPGVELLVHRLLVDLTGTERVSVDLVRPDGTPVLSFDDVPFDPSAGAILVGCRRHFVEQFPPDVDALVRCTDHAGHERIDRYTIHHRIG